MEEILARLRDKNIAIYLDKHDLKIKFNGSKLPDDVLDELKENKASIVEFLIRQRERSVNNALTPAIKNSHYPLSSSQRRLWILSQFEDGNVAYNITEIFVFEGGFKIDSLQYAFNCMIERHESLRTIFKEDENNMVRQFILAPADIDIKINHLDIREEENIAGKIKKMAQDELIKPFNLDTGPLLRISLCRVADDKWFLFYSMHHIISDGWSMRILINEILVLYNCHVNATTNPLLPLRIQYKDYATWQQEQLHDGALKEHKNYWLQQFADPCPVVELPADRMRPLLKTYNGNQVKRKIEKPVAQKLKAICLETGATLFMGLLAAVKTLIYRYTGLEDIVIGSPIAGRDHLDIEDQIGFYVNTIALRTRFSGNDNFRDIIKNVRTVTLEAYEHQVFPFDELVDALAYPKDISRNPLFDIMVVLQNTNVKNDVTADHPEAAVVQSGIYPEVERVISLFDLRIDFTESSDGLFTILEYNSDIFDRWRIEQLFDHLNQLIIAAVESPGMAISRVNYLSQAERDKVLLDFNATQNEYPHDKTLVHLFEEQVKKSPHNIAVVFDNTTLTYLELDDRSNQLANFLVRHIQLPLEARVGILLSRGQELLISMLGILKAGGAYVPLDIAYPEDRILFMMEDAGIEVLLTEKKIAEFANRLHWRSKKNKHLICVDSDDFYKENGDFENTLMSKELWDTVGITATDAISGGGWMSSYTGLYFSEKEMQEYSENAYKKLRGYLRKDMKVLELGCSSGLTMFQIAPHVETYYGTDLSPAILSVTGKKAAENGYDNIILETLPAHDIDKLQQTGFDLIIINSVIHCFAGHNYLRDVLIKLLPKLKASGLIFLGDLMDEDKREDLISDLKAFRQQNRGNGYRTKTDWSKELFVSKKYLDDLKSDLNGISSINYSDKIFTLSNELTRYRFDAIIMVDKNAETAPEQYNRQKFQYNRKQVQQYSSAPASVNISAQHLAYVIYTSGSTGQPKGCMLQHGGIVNRLAWMWAEYGFTKDDVILQKTNPTFDVSVWELFLPLCWGAKMVMCRKEDINWPERILSLIEENKVTCLHFVPGMLNVFIFSIFNKQENTKSLASLRKVFVSGEALAAETIQNWYRQVNIPVYNLYGPTEASIDVTYYNTQPQDTKIPIGKPVWNTQILILDENDQLTPIGVAGEICIAGIALARGYINQPQLTGLRFTAHPFKQGEKIYKTGDTGRWLPDGNIEFSGRKDDQVKIRGHRIELGEIESVLSTHPDIDATVVTVRHNRENEIEIAAYIKSRESLNYAALRLYLSQELPVYMLPARYVQVDTFPLTSSGKIDRKRLPDPEGYGVASGIKYLAPASEIEKKLVSIFEEVLNKNPVGITDDFFETGGDSFKAIRIAARYGQGMSILDIYKYPTVQVLAKYLLTNNKPEYLKALTENSASKDISIIIVPYGAGEPIGYQKLTQELVSMGSNCAVYCLALPRTERKVSDDFSVILAELAEGIIREIKSKIETPVILYGKCIGAGLALELARRLEENGVDLKALCIGGALATLEVPPDERIFISDLARIGFLKKIGATVPGEKEAQSIFSRNVNWDIAVGITSFKEWIINRGNNKYKKLKTPLYCIVGAKDFTTKNYKRKYKEWEFYAEKVKLIVVKGVGHYFSRDKPKELAFILNKIAVGKGQDVCESEKTGLVTGIFRFLKLKRKIKLPDKE